jgi:hypothetical protein
MNDKNLSNLIQRAEAIAVEKCDGHLTIMRFTNGYKVILGSPPLLWSDGDYEHVASLPTNQDLGSALEDFLCRKG